MGNHQSVLSKTKTTYVKSNDKKTVAKPIFWFSTVLFKLKIFIFRIINFRKHFYHQPLLLVYSFGGKIATNFSPLTSVYKIGYTRGKRRFFQ